MSLFLNDGSMPEVSLKTFGMGKENVFLGDYEISLKDFLRAAHYVLTNTNLTENDPRPQFLECVRSMIEVKGWPVIIKGEEKETRRLEALVPLSF